MKKIFSFTLLSLVSLATLQLNQNNNSKELETIDSVNQITSIKRDNGNVSAGAVDDGVFQKNNFAAHYFKHLTSNFGSNTAGSCPYIATEMLLSFYDTYWNDGIVNEMYDQPTCENADSVLQFTKSPGTLPEEEKMSEWGVTRQDVVNYNFGQYCQYIQLHKYESFHLRLLDVAINELGYHNEFSFNTMHFGLGTDLLYQAALIKYYMSHYTTLDGGFKARTLLPIKAKDNINLGDLITGNTIEWVDLRPQAIEKVKSGIPVMLVGFPDLVNGIPQYLNRVANALSQYSLSDYLGFAQEAYNEGIFTSLQNNISTILGSIAEEFSPHVFVAYDYDEVNDHLIVHNGWSNAESTTAVFEDPSWDFQYIMEMTYLEPQMSFNFSNNYIKEEDSSGDQTQTKGPVIIPPNIDLTEYLRPIDSLYPASLETIGNTTTLEPLEYSWEETMADPFYLQKLNCSYELSFNDRNCVPFLTIPNINKDHYKLTQGQYQTVLNSITNKKIYSSLVLRTNNNALEDSDSVSCEIDKPMGVLEEMYQIKPSNYPNSWEVSPFDGQFIQNQTDCINIGPIVTNIKRTRCWKDGGWIVLQPQSLAALNSFIEFTFETPVYAFSYALARRTASSKFGKLVVEIKKENGAWENIKTLTYAGYNQISPISSNNPTRFIYEMSANSSAIYGIRITNNSLRKGITNYDGMLCLDDLVLDPIHPSVRGEYDWYLDYGKSCLPNNIPSNDFSNPNPLDPIIPGSQNPR